MFFRIEPTASGWIVEGGNIEPRGHDGEYKFNVIFKDVATEDDALGDLITRAYSEYEERVRKEKAELEVAAAAEKSKKKTTKKKTTKKKTTKKKSAAENENTNMATGDGLS